MPDIAVDIANTVISFMPYIIAVIIIIAIIIFLARRKGQKEEDIERPPIIEPEEKFINLHKNLLRSQGRRIRHKSVLKFGQQEICKVKRWIPIYLSEKEPIDLLKTSKKIDKKHYNKEIKIMEEQINNLKESDVDTTKVDNDLNLLKNIINEPEKEENHYILETLNFGLINALLYVFNYRMNYMIIPKILVNTDNSQNWNCPSDCYGKPYFDRVFAFSKAGEKYIQDFHDHMTLKQTLKEQVNFIPQMHYFDYKTGRFAAKAQEIARIKRKSYKDREAKFEGSEIPEDEDMTE